MSQLSKFAKCCSSVTLAVAAFAGSASAGEVTVDYDSSTHTYTATGSNSDDLITGYSSSSGFLINSSTSDSTTYAVTTAATSSGCEVLTYDGRTGVSCITSRTDLSFNGVGRAGSDELNFADYTGNFDAISLNGGGGNDEILANEDTDGDAIDLDLRGGYGDDDVEGATDAGGSSVLRGGSGGDYISAASDASENVKIYASYGEDIVVGSDYDDYISLVNPVVGVVATGPFGSDEDYVNCKGGTDTVVDFDEAEGDAQIACESY